jgi:hypothetical protein
MRLFGGAMQNAIIQAAQGEWRKLSETEVHCVDQVLRRQQGSDLQTLIRQGITPSDARIFTIRAACRSATRKDNSSDTPVGTPTAIPKGSPQTSPTQQLLWNHNESTVYLVAQGRTRKFFYKEPRQGMLNAGAKPDSLIFTGEIHGEQYLGTAFVFNSRCGRRPYQVSGPILDNYRRVELRGQAPRGFDSNCSATGYVDDVLAFELIEPAIAAPPEMPTPNQTPGSKPEDTTPSQTPGSKPEDPASILERIQATGKMISDRMPALRNLESRKKVQEIAARLATANTETSLEDLKALRNDANSADHIFEEAEKFNRVSEFADQRVEEISVKIQKITSDAPIIQKIQAAIKTVKLAQSELGLGPLQDALKTLNDLYDKNRPTLRSMEFPSP